MVRAKIMNRGQQAMNASSMKLNQLVGKKISAIKKTRTGITICLDDELELSIDYDWGDDSIAVTLSKFRYQREQVGPTEKITE